MVFTFFINPHVVLGDDIEKFAKKLFNHYEYDNKINRHLKSFFSFEHSKSNASLDTKKNFSKSVTQSIKHTFKIKSKNNDS